MNVDILLFHNVVVGSIFNLFINIFSSFIDHHDRCFVWRKEWKYIKFWQQKSATKSCLLMKQQLNTIDVKLYILLFIHKHVQSLSAKKWNNIINIVSYRPNKQSSHSHFCGIQIFWSTRNISWCSIFVTNINTNPTLY